MNERGIAGIAAAAMCVGMALGSLEQEAPLTGAITFLSRFYGDALGLPKSYDRNGVEVFAVTPSTAVGIIDIRRRGPDAHVVEGHKPVGVSFIVDELEHVDQWYERLQEAGVEVTEPPSDGTETPVRSVQFIDPEGYEMEVFAWLQEQ